MRPGCITSTTCIPLVHPADRAAISGLKFGQQAEKLPVSKGGRGMPKVIILGGPSISRQQRGVEKTLR